MPKWEVNCILTWYRALRCFAIAGLTVYGMWQLYWLSQGKLPPALFLAYTGLPAPTTGGRRSIACLLQGDWTGSLHHNAMAIPLSLLTIVCAIWPVNQFLRGRPIRLPKGTGMVWIAVLATAWCVKLMQVAWE